MFVVLLASATFEQIKEAYVRPTDKCECEFSNLWKIFSINVSCVVLGRYFSNADIRIGHVASVPYAIGLLLSPSIWSLADAIFYIEDCVCVCED